MPKQPQARAISAQVLARIMQEHVNLSRLLPEYLPQLPDARDRALAQELCFGVCRWYHALQFILDGLLDKKIRDKDADLKALALIGLYQFIYLRTPPHAVISATVDACPELGKPWASGLINALLRRFQREQEHWLKLLDEQAADIRYSIPGWLLQMLQQDFPGDWEDICRGNNEHPPQYLRINRQKTTRDNYRNALANMGIQAENCRYSDDCLYVTTAVDVNELPDFDKGHVSVQDLAAQLCRPLLDLEGQQRVLDACTAPGGKLAHILESGLPFAEVVALEKNKKRLVKVEETLARLQMKATLYCADACDRENWWDGKPFDRILLDAPCSASGVIRRHPDIKLLRQPGDINTVALLQSELLSALWPVLKRGGKMLYVTCSVFCRENDERIQIFLENNRDAQSIHIDAAWGTATVHGRQILPGQEAMDGFYYACLQKG
ncbi:MAG TPA: 16S rRNA (cytosine(967)-C(5))-methyltransferase RsmB [Gammaproteobacteria bacterium]|nr:16S rRNA (cytosine(967)-C(5))-methyltransferase RsmB [Gammaproteobacteria bacterium]